jgi:hypothetical protein
MGYSADLTASAHARCSEYNPLRLLTILWLAVGRGGLSVNVRASRSPPAFSRRPSQEARPLDPAIVRVANDAGPVRALVFRLVVRQDPGKILPERPKLGLEPAGAHLQNHQQAGDQIVAMDEELGSTQVIARFLAQPSNDFHSAINVINAHILLATQVVIQMDFIPGLSQALDALDDGFNPDRLRVFRQEGLGAARIVIEEQQAPRGGRLRLLRVSPRRQARKPAQSLPDRPDLVDQFDARKGIHENVRCRWPPPKGPLAAELVVALRI